MSGDESADAESSDSPDATSSADESPASDSAETGESRRLSPLSVPYRIVTRGVGTVFTAAFLGVTGASAVGGPAGIAVAVVLLGLALLALVGYEIARYRRYEYELTDDTLDIHSGVFARRDREIPFRRVQNVDVSRSAIQRVLGIAAVNVETAGGSDTEGVLRYVSVEEARRLQDEIARRKRRLAAGADEEAAAEEPTGETLFTLSNEELLLVGLLSFDVRVPGVLVLLASGSLPSLLPNFGQVGTAAVVLGVVGLAAALFVVSWVASALTAVVNYYDFSLTRVGDDLRYERGLFRRYDGTIPLEKIQTFTVADDPLKRYFGYASLHVETAGYAPGAGGGQNDNQSATAVPLAARGRILSLVRTLDPVGDPDLQRPPKRVRRRYAVRYGLAVAGLTALAYVGHLFVSALPWYLPLVLLPVVPVYAHYAWRHRGYWLGDAHAVTRNGFFSRETKVVPYHRIQTVIDSRTIFQRRWGVATVTIDTAGSLSILGQDAAAVDVDDATADSLREELLGRLRTALARR